MSGVTTAGNDPLNPELLQANVPLNQPATSYVKLSDALQQTDDLTGQVYDIQNQIAALKAAQISIQAGQPGARTSGGGLIQMGFGLQFTPQASRVLINLVGSISNTTVGAQSLLILTWGVGTPPGYGVPSTGSQVGASVTFTPLVANQSVPFAASVVLAGLTAGTAYWVDPAMGVGAGAANLYDGWLLVVGLLPP
jgi:hypothetical protein